MKLEAIDRDILPPDAVVSMTASGSRASIETTGIRKLCLNGFRNYPQLEVHTHAKAVLLTGANGAGKTNLLEAISMLAPGRGLRRAGREELGYRNPQAQQSENWAIFAEIHGHGPSFIGTGISEHTEKGRAIRIDHAPASQNDLLDRISLSWFTPQMDGLFLAAPSQRRRFLDRLAMTFDPAHNGRLLRYEKTWRERNHLLQEQIKDESWLQAIENVLAETGVALMATRTQMLADICRISQSQDSHFSADLRSDDGPGGGLAGRWPASYRYRGSDSINRPA